MIKFEKTEVMNFEGAFRGMRNPLESHEKSDSMICTDINDRDGCPEGCLGCKYYGDSVKENVFCIGANDMKLAQNLIKAGSDHRKFLRQIFVSVDITAPLYWWKEFETYRVGVAENPTDIEMNSGSTMHNVHKQVFTLADFSHEHLINEPLIEVKPGLVEQLNLQAKSMLEITIAVFNAARHMYLKTNDKKYWWQMIQLLPSSYNQKRTITFNYEVLRNIYGSRKNHMLDEWSVGFMEWIDSLPYADELIKWS